MVYDWHKEYFEKKVLPGFLKEMVPCVSGDGFYPWLQEVDLKSHDELVFLEQRIGEIWREKGIDGNRERFKQVCQSWVMAHIRLKPKYLAAMSPEGAQRMLI